MKCLKWIALTTLSLSCLSASAANIPATEITDNYIGAGYNNNDNRDNNRDGVINDYDKDVYGSYGKYDIDKMVVSREGTTLTVDIFTSFWNNIGGNSIYLGDLFMAVTDENSPAWNPSGSAPFVTDRYSSNNNHTGTNWNYAYDLSGDRRYSSGTGALKSNFNNSDVNLSTGRYNQAVTLKDSRDNIVHSKSTWSIGNSSQEYFKTFGDRNYSYRNLHLSFDVAGTALETANQIAFRWAMTCANDIIEGLVSVKSPDNTTSVPEPQTLLLMLLGMAGIAYRRKQQH